MGITLNVNMSAKIRNNVICALHYIWIWNPATCSCENGKYSVSIIDDSIFACEEIIEETKIIPAI